MHSRINSLPTPGSGVVGLGVTVSAVATRLPWRRWQRSASYPIAAIVACDIVDKRAQSDRQVRLFDLNLIFVFVEAYRCKRTFLVVVPCTKNNMSDPCIT